MSTGTVLFDTVVNVVINGIVKQNRPYYHGCQTEPSLLPPITTKIVWYTRTIKMPMSLISPAALFQALCDSMIAFDLYFNIIEP